MDRTRRIEASLSRLLDLTWEMNHLTGLEKVIKIVGRSMAPKNTTSASGKKDNVSKSSCAFVTQLSAKLNSPGKKQMTTARSRILILGLVPGPAGGRARVGEMNHMIGSVVDICTRGTMSRNCPGKVTIVYLGRVAYSSAILTTEIFFKSCIIPLEILQRIAKASLVYFSFSLHNPLQCFCKILPFLASVT